MKWEVSKRGGRDESPSLCWLRAERRLLDRLRVPGTRMGETLVSTNPFCGGGCGFSPLLLLFSSCFCLLWFWTLHLVLDTKRLRYRIFVSFPSFGVRCSVPRLAPPAALPPPPPPAPPVEGLAGCLAQLTADQSRVCHSGLSPDAPNGAPFSCLVGGSGGGGKVGRRGQIDRLTEIVPGRQRERERGAKWEPAMPIEPTGRDAQTDGGRLPDSAEETVLARASRSAQDVSHTWFPLGVCVCAWDLTCLQ